MIPGDGRDYDVIVVGSGCAGHCAALSAREAGAHVLVVEAADRVGGSSRLSGAVFYAGGTRMQAAAAIADSAEAFFEHYMTFNQWLIEPCLARAYCFGAAGTLDWLNSLGCSYRADDLYRAGIENTKRGHQHDGYGEALIDVLHNQASARGIEFVLNARVERLLIDDGAVVGIHASGQDVRAGAVVLACGGLGTNAELRKRLFPDSVKHGWDYYVGAQSNQGDYVALAEAAGGVLAQSTLGRGIITRASHYDRIGNDTFVPQWHCFFNALGRRFIDETANYAVLGRAIDAQPGHRCYSVFDHETFATSDGRSFYAGPESPSWDNPNWRADMMAEMLREGHIVGAPTLGALAERLGIHAGALAANVERYNHWVSAGRDEQFFKDMRLTRPIATAPFYAAEFRPATFVASSCGLEIDVQARVHDASDRPITGLYAAGEAAGGISASYIGGGNSIGPAAVFGRIAGSHAAALVQGRTLDSDPASGHPTTAMV